MSQELTSKLNNESVNKTEKKEKVDFSNMTLETQLNFLHLSRLNDLKNKLDREFGELKKGQNQVMFLHKLLKRINKETNEKGEFDCSNDKEFQELLLKAKDMGVDINETKFKYNKDDKDRLVDNLRMTIQDLNVNVDMKNQMSSRYMNERYESFHFIKTNMKILDETKRQSIREIKK